MKTIRSGVTYNIIYQILLMIVPLITSPYLSRVLGADGIGEYQFRYSIAYYFFLFAMLGVNTYGNREVAKYRESKNRRSIIFWQIFYIQLFASMGLSVIYILGGLIFLGAFDPVYIVQIIQILSACVDVNWYAFALEEFKLTTIRSIIIKIFTTLAIFLFVRTESDLLIYAIIVLGGNFIGLCMIMPCIFGTTSFQKPFWREIKKHLKPNFILFLPSIASSVYIYMDKVMLGFLANNKEVGFYNYAENIVSIPNAVTTALSTVMFSRVSNMVAHGKLEKSKKYLNKALFYVSAVNIMLVFGVIAVSDIFVPWYLGKEYIYTAFLVKVRSFLIILNGISSILKSQWLIPLNRDKQYSYSIVGGAVINILLNAFFISKNGAVGASVATVLAFIYICAVQFYYSKDAVNLGKFIMNMVPFIIFGIIMLGIIKKINRTYLADMEVVGVMAIDVLTGGIFYLSLSVGYIFIKNKKRQVK